MSEGVVDIILGDWDWIRFSETGIRYGSRRLGLDTVFGGWYWIWILNCFLGFFEYFSDTFLRPL